MNRLSPLLLLALAACGSGQDRPAADSLPSGEVSDTIVMAERPRGFAAARTQVRVDTIQLCPRIRGRGVIDTAPLCTPVQVRRAADTVNLPVPLPAAIAQGIPIGPINYLKGAEPRYGRHPEYTLNASTAVEPSTIVQQIARAEREGLKLLLGMTEGSHTQFAPLPGKRFQYALWKARQDQFNTPAIRAAVAAGFTKGIIIGLEVMDEPPHSTWNGGQSYGTVVTKATVDSMCAHAKSIFGQELPAGPIASQKWLPGVRYQVCDLFIDQFSPLIGNAVWGPWLAESVRQARANGMALVISFNPLNYSKPRTSGTACPVPQTGGPGTGGAVNDPALDPKGCRIHPDTMRTLLRAAAAVPEVCAVTWWQHDTITARVPGFRAAVLDARVIADARPATNCRRRS